MDDNKGFYKKIMVFLKPFIREQLLTLVCIILGSAVSLQYPLIIKIIVDDVLINQNTRMLFTMLVIYILLFLLGFLFTFLTQFMNSLSTQLFAFNVKKQLFLKFQRMPLSVLNKTSMGEITSTYNKDIDNISRFLSTDLLAIISNILNIIVVVIIMSFLNLGLTLMVVLVLPFFYLSVLTTRGHLKKSLEKRRELVSHENKLLQNVFPNIKLVKLFVTQKFFFKKFLILQDGVMDTEIRTAVSTSLLNQLTGIVYLAGGVTIIWFGANLVFQNQLTIGGLMAFYTYVPLLFTPLRAIVGSSVQFRGFKIAFSRITKFLDVESEKDVKDYYRIREGKVDFQNVTFSYNDKMVLQNANLNIQAREKIAIIGENGSGKTTLVNLLLKLYPLEQGKILIDNIDITKYSNNYLRKNIGIVSQEVNFFNLSLLDNFGLACPKCSERDIIQACQTSGAYQFISQLPDGLKTMVGERGYNFSGGQLQKMAIARLILKNPPIIVFDEAASALDPESTQAFYRLFTSTFKDRTLIFILHDLKSLSYADRVVLLKDGSIEKEYSHAEVISDKDLIEKLTIKIAK